MLGDLLLYRINCLYYISIYGCFLFPLKNNPFHSSCYCPPPLLWFLFLYQLPFPFWSSCTFYFIFLFLVCVIQMPAMFHSCTHQPHPNSPQFVCKDYERTVFFSARLGSNGKICLPKTLDISQERILIVPNHLNFQVVLVVF